MVNIFSSKGREQIATSVRRRFRTRVQPPATPQKPDDALRFGILGSDDIAYVVDMETPYTPPLT